MLDGIKGLLIVDKSHVEWNVVLRGLFEYLSDSVQVVYGGKASPVRCLLWWLMFTEREAESIL